MIKTSFSPPRNDYQQIESDRRLVRWKIQKIAQELLPDERVAFCMKRMQGATVNILHSPDRNSAHYEGLLTCGSVWVCPICATKIAERRRLELEQAVARCRENGGVVYLATYTIAHKHYDELASLLHSFLSARQKFRQGRAAQNIRQKFGILGTVSVREVTWSKINGWHPHCHELIFFSHAIDAEEYARIARERWYNSAEHEGLSMNEHGFQLDETHDAVADYIVKFGREPIRNPWGITAEMTKGHLKTGHTEEHLTPFAMLLQISEGQDELKPIFREYAQWFKGKHQLVWSAGLRKLLLSEIDEKSDEELAQEPEQEAVLLGQLDYNQWNIVVSNNARGKLLEVARFGDWQQVLTFLATLKTKIRPAPPTSSTGIVYE